MDNSVYLQEYNPVLNREIYYIPATKSQNKLVILQKPTTHITNIISPNSNTPVDQYNFIIKIINHQLWKYPNAICEMINYIDYIKIEIIKNSTTENKTNDIFIYDKLNQLYKKLCNKYNIPNKLIESNRASGRLKSIQKNILNYIKLKPTSYLDIGCFDGNITNLIGNYFNLDISNVYGTDIVNIQRNKQITFKPYDGKKLPFDDNSIDCITSLMVFHHIPNENINYLLSEIHRVLIDDGLCIIREHDVTKRIQFYNLDIMHKFYDYVWNDNTERWTDTFIPGNYRSRNEWDNLFIMNGFELNINPKKNDQDNPFMSYYCCYKKIGLNI